jgi:hypothetical protein
MSSVEGDSLRLFYYPGASVATFFTFLPSFLFIFLGGPGVEATRGDLNNLNKGLFYLTKITNAQPYCSTQKNHTHNTNFKAE